jgi:type IV pilus assembly protein PilE
MKTRHTGFTLIELMIVIVIVALLLALAVPSYTQWIRKGHRGEAQATLINWANNLEIFRAGNSGYDAAGAPVAPTDPDGRYVFTIASGTNTFTLTATAQAVGGQNTDQERGTSCTPMTLNQSNTKTPADCWQQ